MRSYGQFCGLAKALDVIGDRWALLIVRELLIRERCRYTDLRQGLPGIATNLLAQRLRDLEDNGVISREEAPPPIATTLYRLTPRGRELEEVIKLLGHWAAPLLAAAPKTDVLRAHWLALPVKYYLRDNTPEEPPVVLAVRAGDEPMVIETVDGAVRLSPGSVEKPDAVMAGPVKLVTAVILGHTTLERARAAGLRYDGDAAVLNRIQPKAKAGGKLP